MLGFESVMLLDARPD